MGGAMALAGHWPMMPPLQNTPAAHGEHASPRPDWPRYPGRHTHCEMLLAPMGDVEFSGQRRLGGAATMVPLAEATSTTAELTGM